MAAVAVLMAASWLVIAYAQSGGQMQWQRLLSLGQTTSAPIATDVPFKAPACSRPAPRPGRERATSAPSALLKRP